MSLEMSAEVRDDVLVMALDGELTQTDVVSFKEWIASQLDDAPMQVQVDCHAMEYIDSMGLGALIFLRKAVLDRGGELRLVRVSGWLLKFLQVTGLKDTFIGTQPETRA